MRLRVPHGILCGYASAVMGLCTSRLCHPLFLPLSSLECLAFLHSGSYAALPCRYAANATLARACVCPPPPPFDTSPADTRARTRLLGCIAPKAPFFLLVFLSGCHRSVTGYRLPEHTHYTRVSVCFFAVFLSFFYLVFSSFPYAIATLLFSR